MFEHDLEKIGSAVSKHSENIKGFGFSAKNLAENPNKLAGFKSQEPQLFGCMPANWQVTKRHQLPFLTVSASQSKSWLIHPDLRYACLQSGMLYPLPPIMPWPACKPAGVWPIVYSAQALAYEHVALLAYYTVFNIV